MKSFILLSGLFICVLLALFTSCTTSSAKTESEVKRADSVYVVKRGEYLVTVGLCDDCHSPKTMGPKGPEIDMTKRLSGFPASRPVPAYNKSLLETGIVQFNEDFTSAAGQWGVSFAANLTSDPTGASSWPIENFKYALRHGKLKGIKEGRNLLPPMPWFNFAKMTDKDIEAIYAYLKTLKPITNAVPGPKSTGEIK